MAPKTLEVPLDGSEYAERALRQAHRHAVEIDRDLDVVRAVSSRIGVGVESELYVERGDGCVCDGPSQDVTRVFDHLFGHVASHDDDRLAHLLLHLDSFDGVVWQT